MATSADAGGATVKLTGIAIAGIDEFWKVMVTVLEYVPCVSVLGATLRVKVAGALPVKEPVAGLTWSHDPPVATVTADVNVELTDPVRVSVCDAGRLPP